LGMITPRDDQRESVDATAIFDAVIPDSVLADAIGPYILRERPDLAERKVFHRYTMTDAGLRVRLYRDPPNAGGM